MGWRAFQPGCCCGSCFFVTDNTGSMGSTIATLKPGFKQLVDDFGFKFGVASYVDDQTNDPHILQACTADKAKVKAALDMYTAGGGGDTDENFTQALVLVSQKWSEHGCGQSGLIILTGDAKSHVDVYSVFDAISALTDANLTLLALNTAGAGAGLDGDNQASDICAAVDGKIINNVLSTPYSEVKDAVQQLMG